MIDHVTANVVDFERAKRFYAEALAPLGYSVQMEFEGAGSRLLLVGARQRDNATTRQRGGERVAGA